MLQFYFCFQFPPQSCLGHKVLFLSMSLKLLKLLVYLSHGSLCGPISEVEKHGICLNSWHLICGIFLWQWCETSKYSSLSPEGTSGKGDFCCTWNTWGWIRFLECHVRKFYVKKKAFWSVQLYDFILNVFFLFSPNFLPKENSILAWLWPKNETKNFLDFNGQFRVLWLVVIS